MEAGEVEGNTSSARAKSFVRKAGGLLVFLGVDGECGSLDFDRLGALKGRGGRRGRRGWPMRDEPEEEEDVDMTDALRERSTRVSSMAMGRQNRCEGETL